MPARTVEVRPQVASAVRSLIDRQSVSGASRQLDLAEATVVRLAAGIPCSRGTAALVTARLSSLGLLSAGAA